MVEIRKNSIRMGLIFGFVILFLIFIGLPITASEIIGDFLKLNSSSRVGNIPGLTVFVILMGWWASSSAVKEVKHNHKNSVLFGGLTGIIIGAIVGISCYIFGSLDGANVDFRGYFVQLSRPAIQLLLLGKDITTGSILNFFIFLISGIFGGLLSSLSHQWQTSKRLTRLLGGWKDNFVKLNLIQKNKDNQRSRLIVILIGLVILFGTPLLLGNYWNYALGTVGIYVLMGLGLNIVVGLAGLLDLGYVAFFAIGAYTMGLLTSPEPIGIQMGFWGAMIISVLLASFAGILLGLPVLGMRGDYLAIVTLGFGEIIRVLIKSDAMTPYLGGPQGVRDIKGPSIFGLSFDSEQAFIYLIFLGIFLVIFITNRLQNSRIGRAWIAMREDETVAQAQGINTLLYKLMAFATGAAFAGLGGVLFASRNQYTGPEDHTLLVSINVLCLLIVGGMGSIPGVIIGAFVLKGLPEILRDLELYRFIAFGALLVVMMILRPEGLLPASRLRLELREEADDQDVAEPIPTEEVA